MFSDGSSVYDFEKDGTFRSGPLDGLSGRTIAGHWLRQFDTFVVRGTWSWVNGASAIHDYRRMPLSVSPESVEATRTRRVIGAFPPSIPTAKMYRCYFVVDELVKVPSLK